VPVYTPHIPESWPTQTGVVVEKLLLPKLAETKIALGCLTNGFLGFLNSLHAPTFICLGGRWTFSTTTGQ